MQATTKKTPAQNLAAGLETQMDEFWQQALNHIQSSSSPSYRFIVPSAMVELVKDAVPYSELTSCTVSQFSGLVIHKGLYQEIEPTFLFHLVKDLAPTFANEVFIVLETTGSRLRSIHKHLGHLREIKNWIVANADPSVVNSQDIDGQRPESSEQVLALMAKFVAQNLAKAIDPTHAKLGIAIAETAERFNDTAWFWVDDTGKTAELFAVPNIRKEYPELADATLDYVLRLSPDSIIQRRAALPELRLLDNNPENFRAYNSFFNLTGNLTKGVICPSIRFNDNRTRAVAEYSGNVIHFTYCGRRQTVDIENSIKNWSILEYSDRIVFSHTSAISGTPLFGSPSHVCDVTYAYTLWRARPTIEVSVSVRAATGVTLRVVHITTAFDQLSKGGGFDTVVTGRGDTYQTNAVPGASRTTLARGATDYVSLFEGRVMPGFAVGLHVHLNNGDQLKDVTVEGSQLGHFHWVYTTYDLKKLQEGQTKTIIENRLLTGGGYYTLPDIYKKLIIAAETAAGDVDPSMSYDIGAELNAVATTLLFAKRGLYDHSSLSDQRLQELKAWFDRHLDIYLSVSRPDDENVQQRVFVRGLSFVILALDCMERAFEGEYRARLVTCVQLLLRLEVPVTNGDEQSLFSTHTADDPSPPELDCQGAALLALARAAPWGDSENQIRSAIRRGLRAILIVSINGEQYDQPTLTYNTIAVRKQAGGSREDTGYWNFKLGLALRAFKAIQRVQELGHLGLDQDTLDLLERLIERAQEALQPSLRFADGTLEALTSQRSGETNSETQPWVALGLAAAIEWEILGRRVESSSCESHAETSSILSSARGYFDKRLPPLNVKLKCSDEQASRLLKRIVDSWEELGRSRPHWSVLTADQFLPHQIETTEPAFFATGEHERDKLLAAVRRAGRDPSEFKEVFQYGCGLGRVTNFLAESFDRVRACDASRQHLERARAHTHEIGRSNVTYLLSTLPAFGMNRQFDLWFSLFALQHYSPPIIAMILRRALTMLRPGGLAVFQCPTYAPNYQFDIDEYLASQVPESGLEIHFLPQSELFKIVRDAGCSIVEVVEDDTCNPQWISNTVVVTKE